MRLSKLPPTSYGQGEIQVPGEFSNLSAWLLVDFPAAVHPHPADCLGGDSERLEQESKDLSRAMSEFML